MPFWGSLGILRLKKSCQNQQKKCLTWCAEHSIIAIHNKARGDCLNIEQTVSGLILELRRGTLILLVLSQLRQPMYGYSLVKKLNDHGILMDANTLYPLMRRLEGQGLLSSQWDTGEAKPRKYYRITPDGLTVLEKTKEYWKTFSTNVDELLGEKHESGSD